MPAVDDWTKQSEEVFEETHCRIETALQRSKEQADRHRGEIPFFQPGDWVWFSTRDLRFGKGCKKLHPKCIGPFQMVKQINHVTYQLDLPAQYHISPSFHVSLLKPVVPGPLDEASTDRGWRLTAPWSTLFVRCWTPGVVKVICSTSSTGRYKCRHVIAAYSGD